MLSVTRCSVCSVHYFCLSLHLFLARFCICPLHRQLSSACFILFSFPPPLSYRKQWSTFISISQHFTPCFPYYSGSYSKEFWYSILLWHLHCLFYQNVLFFYFFYTTAIQKPQSSSFSASHSPCSTSKTLHQSFPHFQFHNMDILFLCPR